MGSSFSGGRLSTDLILNKDPTSTDDSKIAATKHYVDTLCATNLASTTPAVTTTSTVSTYFFANVNSQQTLNTGDRINFTMVKNSNNFLVNSSSLFVPVSGFYYVYASILITGNSNVINTQVERLFLRIGSDTYYTNSLITNAVVSGVPTNIFTIAAYSDISTTTDISLVIDTLDASTNSYTLSTPSSIFIKKID